MMHIIQIPIIIITIVIVLFVPGFALSYTFFPKDKIRLIERVTLSFALSIAIVPLVIFYTNLVGLPITILTVLLQIIGIVLVALLAADIQNRRRKKQ